MSYQPKQHVTIHIPQDLRGKMRNFLDEKIQYARNGIDLNEGKKGSQPFVVHYSHDMSDEVFELGCKIGQDVLEFNHHAWVHWMVDAQIDRDAGGMTIRHRSQFYCNYAEKYLGQILRDYLGVPVKFVPDRRIKNRVEQ